jgi:hypothetical protein
MTWKPNKTTLFYMMLESDEQATKVGVPDGAWQVIIESCVTFWNSEYGTHYDESDLFQEYLDWKKTQ